MSNGTRPGGYDERLVVPLEASRRGAHRARANALVAALPVLAVVVVVAAVIGIAYTLFLKGSNGTEDGSTSAPSTTSAPGPAATSSPVPAASSSGSGASASTSPSAGTAAKPDKTAEFTIYNGSTPAVTGLGAKALTAVQGDGWSGAKLDRGSSPVKTTRTKVYYGQASQAATAEAIVKTLGVGSARLKGSIASQGIVVIVGNDYSG
jgi:hypothetical protein